MENVFLQRIPDPIYRKMADTFAEQYRFNNGERMRIANYFVGLSQELVDSFLQFIEEISEGMLAGKYPALPTPKGFAPHPESLLEVERKGGFSFGSFDMAVGENGLQNIEFQAVATYPISAAKLSQILLQEMPHKNAYIFADSPKTSWAAFIDLYEEIITGKQDQGNVITDRLLKEQKTNFEFYAIQKELRHNIDMVDSQEIFEQDGGLYYMKQGKAEKIRRLYNRVLLAEALFEDNYPDDENIWTFRFDKKYEDLKFINHPIKQYEVSKRLSPYISHPFNPECYELSNTAEDFKAGKLACKDYIWKHKWGAAGHRLILSPSLPILDSLSEDLDGYIAQKSVDFKAFTTDDGQEKIVELRFMTASNGDRTIIVPMARIGHITEDDSGVRKFKIHFGDNNKEGYGFSPVLIFAENKKE